ncbi:MAG: hypothetical protein ABDK94_07330 [Atribacterota bacterium]
MPLEDILEKISQEAETHKKAILEKASKEAKFRLQKIEEELHRESVRILERRRREIEAEIQRKMAAIKLQSRHEIGKVKNEAVKLLKQRLTGLFLDEVEKSYQRWCERILLHSVQSGDEEVWMFPQEGERLGQKFLEEVNKKTRHQLRFGGILDVPNERGFILKKGGMSVSVTFSTILDDFLKRNEGFIVKTLFQGVSQ